MASNTQIKFLTTVGIETWKTDATNPKGFRREFQKDEVVNVTLFPSEDVADIVARGLDVYV